MANNYFQFRQFIIRQDRCAMKVGTDACIFGASIARYIVNKRSRPVTMLDIGAGTGLLSLMVAQKTKLSIDAVELDGQAFRQALDNFGQSPWSRRLDIFNENALLFDPGKKYDCIVSNPPFYEGDLKSDDDKKNAAKHDTSLTVVQLQEIIDRLISPQGFFAVLLPFHRMDFFIDRSAKSGYYLNERLLIRHSSRHPFARCILFFSHHREEVVSNELAIKDEAGHYTPGFTDLLKDYYLQL